MKPIDLSLAFAAILGVGEVNATTVYFNDANRGPSDTLQIGGVTIYPYTTIGPWGQPATVLGSGLGLDNGVGPIDELDRQMHYSVGEAYPDTSLGSGRLYLQVDGIINSITIVPIFRAFSADGSLLPDKGAFFCIRVQAGSDIIGMEGDYYTFDATDASPVAINLEPSYFGTSNYVAVAIESDEFGGQAQTLWSYRQQHLSEEQTLQFGLTIQSLDYTAIPEPNIAALLLLLLVMGFFGPLCAGRKHTV